MIVRKVINIYAPLTSEQDEALKNIKDEDIDYSDIPKLTVETI